MSVIPETSTAGPDITITVDRGVLTTLVKGLLSILHPNDFPGPLSGAAKTKVPVQSETYTYVMENLGLPNHGTKFALTYTVMKIMDRTPAPDYETFVRGEVTPYAYNHSVKVWKQAVIDGIVDRYMGLTSEDYPEGLAPLDMPHWWQKKHLDPKTCLPTLTESNTVRIMRVEA